MIALCFILSYRHVLHKEAFWREWIYPNRDIIHVYFHCKNISKVSSQWIRDHAVPASLTQQTTYTNVVPAYMALLMHALHHDENNQWMCMLTDSCVPIITPDDFRAMYCAYQYKSIIHCQPAYWNIDLHPRGNLKYLHPKYRLANDPWFTLSRNHAQLCILFMQYKQSTYQQIVRGGLGNESLFAIILRTTNEDKKGGVMNTSATICDWTRMAGPTSPYFFEFATPENVSRIQAMLAQHPHAMFLRKVSAAFPDTTLQSIAQSRTIHVPMRAIIDAGVHNIRARIKKYTPIAIMYIVICAGLFICYYYYGYNLLNQGNMIEL